MYFRMLKMEYKIDIWALWQPGRTIEKVMGPVELLGPIGHES